MAPARRNFAECDMSRVDRLAVSFTCNGTRMRLNADERVYAISKMAGRVKTRDIAFRLHTYEREVVRIIKALGGIACPVCKQLAMHDHGVLARHIDSLGVTDCPMSGKPYDDPEIINPRRGWYAAS